jgi:2',3'-cyclic-nucleotide 2'-phosphodiesterase (5'-nucleotidase family)
MNNLDGDPKKFDPRMFVAFGNHEFDDSDCNKSPAPLMARLNESQFTWLNVNLDFSNCPSMKDVMAQKTVKRTAVVELNGIKFGIFGIGLTPDPKDSKKYPRFGDIYEAARGAIKELKGKKADVIIGLTHLEKEDDELLLRSLSEYGLDMIVGGHEHEEMTIRDAKDVVRGFKSDSDAKTAREITIRIPAKGKRADIVSKRLWMLKDGEVERDEDMAKLATKWSKEAEARICADRKKAKREPNGLDCLQTEAGTAQFPVALEESDNRTKETEFGRWIAEAVRRATEADVAIVAAGSLGLNTNLEKGTMLRLKQVVDIFRFDDIVVVREVPQSVACDAIRRAFAKPGNGPWPHISGLKAEGAASNPAEILKKWDTIKRDDGTTFPCDETIKLKVASSPYLLCGGDGYPVMADKGEAGEKCGETVRRKPGDRPKYPEGRYISAIAEQTIKRDKGLVMPPDPGE